MWSFHSYLSFQESTIALRLSKLLYANSVSFDPIFSISFYIFP